MIEIKENKLILTITDAKYLVNKLNYYIREVQDHNFQAEVVLMDEKTNKKLSILIKNENSTSLSSQIF